MGEPNAIHATGAKHSACNLVRRTPAFDLTFFLPGEKGYGGEGKRHGHVAKWVEIKKLTAPEMLMFTHICPATSS